MDQEMKLVPIGSTVLSKVSYSVSEYPDSYKDIGTKGLVKLVNTSHNSPFRGVGLKD